MNGTPSKCSISFAAIALTIFVALVCPCEGTRFIGFPEDKFELSIVSDRILLVDVTETKWIQHEKADDGEVREFQVLGSVVEDIRGKSTKRDFKHVAYLLKVEDPAKNDPHGLISNSNKVQEEDTNVFECKAKNRYVVIYAFDLVFFISVSNSDQKWRKRIKDYDPLFGQAKKVVRDGALSKPEATNKEAEQAVPPNGP